ncbi:LemA family protein [Kangiella geojedonensis]|uniref:Membrane protein n=1 Tax=Kangiella geojedonensis TaxID=914150 RepID=A0A0F6RCU0_9GAMM|nr:LemA family protein [Kangiella geojedonensis]AKE52316.1 membrane protein [Kangiella geojedonensis]
MTITIIILVVIALWALWTYNTIITLKNQVSSAWSDIDVQLTRRHDLIPQLVKTVQTYKNYEQETLELTTLLRRAEDNNSPSSQESLEAKINQKLDKLILLQEAYPELKANNSFLELMKALADTEDKLQYARRYYNGSVKVYNTKLQQVPDNLIASLFRFKEAEFFTLKSPEMAKAVTVDLKDS